MTLIAPALPDEPCPFCDAMNQGAAYHVFRVADERGLHYECTSCGADWKRPVCAQCSGSLRKGVCLNPKCA